MQYGDGSQKKVDKGQVQVQVAIITSIDHVIFKSTP